MASLAVGWASSLDPPSVKGLSLVFVQLESWEGGESVGRVGGGRTRGSTAPVALVHLPDCAESHTLSFL